VTKDEADDRGASVDATQRRFDALQAITGLGSWEFDPATGERWWSVGCARLFGFEGSIDVPPLNDLRDRIHPDDREKIGSILAASASEAAAQTTEFRVVLPDGRIRWLEGRLEPSSGPIGRVQWRGTVQDITTHHDEAELAHRISRARTTLSEGSRALTRATDEQDLLDAICRIAVGLAGYSLAWVGFAEDDDQKSVHVVARYGDAAPYLDEISVTWADDARGRGPTGTAIRTGVVCLAHDLAVEPTYEPWRAAAARHRLASSISLPLLKDGVAFGAFMVYAPEPGGFGDTETEILVGLADDLAFGIRTLRERSERDQLAAAVGQVAESIVVTDREARITYVNSAFERVTGFARDEVIGQNPRLLKSGLHPPSFYEAMWAALTDGSPWVGDLVNRRKDGSLVTEEAVISPIRDPSGAITGYVAVQHDATRERALLERSTELFRERALISETIRSLRAGDTPEATAQAICRQVASLTGIAAAQLLLFESNGRAMPIGFVVAGQADPPLQSLPHQRSRQLRGRAAEGPWIEPWANRQDHPYDQPLKGVGIRSLAHAPVSYDERLIGLLTIQASDTVDKAAIAEAVPALVEFADLAGALIGRDVAERTEVGRDRDHISSTIAERAFYPVFQPIVELEHNRIVGYEALTRFTDGADPQVLFAEAVASGLGPELEIATLQAALAAAAALPRSAWLNLNASPELIIAGEPLRTLLRGNRRRLVLEVTEHTAIADYPAFRAAMAALGPKVELAVDDAGAGFASLRHILELRPAFVKLDRSLVTGLESDYARHAMIAGLRHFARATGFRLIAEGIETDNELAVLRALDIQLGQGYLLGRPMPTQTTATTA
jgi:PAS domain S-box-containing protein